MGTPLTTAIYGCRTIGTLAGRQHDVWALWTCTVHEHSFTHSSPTVVKNHGRNAIGQKWFFARIDRTQ